MADFMYTCNLFVEDNLPGTLSNIKTVTKENLPGPLSNIKTVTKENLPGPLSNIKTVTRENLSTWESSSIKTGRNVAKR